MTAPTSAFLQIETTPSGVPGAQKSWLEFQHPEYVIRRPKWVIATDVYTGDVVTRAKLPRYLVQKAQGEHTKAFEERMRIADYTPHFATVIDGLVGMLFAVEEEATRIFQDDTGHGLGDPDDPDTIIGRLWQHADPDGNGWLTVFKELASELCTTHVHWQLVYSQGARAMLRNISPLAVPNWRYEKGVLSEVLLEETVDARTSIQSRPSDMTRQFMLYRLDGFQRYRMTRDNDRPDIMSAPLAVDAATGGVEGEDFGTYRFVGPTGEPALPIYPVRLALKRDVGYLWARKALAIFNLESVRDAVIRSFGFPKFLIEGTRAEYETIREDISQGWNLMHVPPTAQRPHSFAAPPSDPAKIATDILIRKVDEFYNTAHQAYGDSARERTATEARQDVARGAGAFLNLLKTTIDDAENQAAWRVAQIELPKDRKSWYVARVERSDNFLPADPDIGIERLQKRVLGTDRAVPVGIIGKVTAALQIANWQGLGADEDELTADIKARELLDVLTLQSGVPMPPVLMQYIVALKLVAIGKLPLDAAEKLLSDAEVTAALADVLKTADAKALTAQRQAEAFPGLASGRNGGPPPKPSGGDLGKNASTDEGTRPNGSDRAVRLSDEIV